MKIKRLDHIVLTVSDLAQAERFYHEVFDMPVIKDQTTEDVITLRCGHQLIRLRKANKDSDLRANNQTIVQLISVLSLEIKCLILKITLRVIL